MIKRWIYYYSNFPMFFDYSFQGTGWIGVCSVYG